MQRFISSVALTALLLLVCIAIPARAQTTQFNGVTVPGVIITHSPQSSGIYIGSPAIVILPNGDYLASHDEFGPKSTEKIAAVTRIFRSTDRGRTWTPRSVLQGQFWSNLFVHGDALYILGTDSHSNDLVIRRSTDGGATWTTPSDADHGLLRSADSELGYHTAPMPMVSAHGRLWRGFESRSTQERNDLRVGIMSIPLDADLLVADNWTFSNQIPCDKNWLPDNAVRSWRESGAVLAPDDSVVNVVRVDVERGIPEVAAIVRVVDPHTVTFDPDHDMVPLPGGSKKFTIRRAPDGTYWSLTNPVNEGNYSADARPGSIRNILALVRSDDLRHWTVDRIVARDLSDVKLIGFQYPDWQFDGHDIVAVSRTAYPDGVGGAHNYHDANFLTFHQIENVLPATSHEQ
ncbi:MAG: exo-alpha-sialidase [Phycisphaeraceae bacterium]|nr:exo-alpha-sialidase [Phycisphaeraceae bacterium]